MEMALLFILKNMSRRADHALRILIGVLCICGLIRWILCKIGDQLFLEDIGCDAEQREGRQTEQRHHESRPEAVGRVFEHDGVLAL